MRKLQRASKAEHEPNGRRVYLEERRRTVTTLRVIYNLKFREIAEKLPELGFNKVRPERAWRDHQRHLTDRANLINSSEETGKLVVSLEGLFNLALAAYSKAERRYNDGTKLPDPYGQAVLLREAREILERIGNILGAFREKHEHTGSISIIDEIAQAERAIEAERASRGLSPRKKLPLSRDDV
jgi:hypothetical protein